MKIGIDISQIVYETGVSWYTKKLVENLLKIDSENEYILFGGSLRKIGYFKAWSGQAVRGSYQLKTFPFPPTLADFIWNKLHILPIEVFTGNLDVFHSSDWTQPETSAFKVTTIHDLSAIKFPEWADPKILQVQKRRLDWVAKEVDRIIAPSIATKNDILELGFDLARIRVVPEAPTASAPSDEENVEKVRQIYQIFSPYILSVGVGPRKNTDLLLQAFKLFNKENNFKLVLVGETRKDYETSKNVIFTGHVSQENIEALYSDAKVLVYPSLYEGFGLPILDAFVCGCPVVTSNFGSMAEVAGDAAILVDPNEVTSILGGMQKAIEDEDALIKKGFERVKQFSWQKTAQETLKVYQESSI